MLQTRQGSVTGSENDSDPATNIQEVTISETTILITYAISTTQYYSLLLSDLYDVESDTLNKDAICSILSHIRPYQNEIIEG
jgi:hypothetical protein